MSYKHFEEAISSYGGPARELAEELSGGTARPLAFLADDQGSLFGVHGYIGRTGRGGDMYALFTYTLPGESNVTVAVIGQGPREVGEVLVSRTRDKGVGVSARTSSGLEGELLRLYQIHVGTSETTVGAGEGVRLRR